MAKTNTQKKIELGALLFCVQNGKPFWNLKPSSLVVAKDTTKKKFTAKSPFVNERGVAKAPFCFRPDSGNPELAALSQEPIQLQYQFSDGTILNSHEIFYHPYVEAVDPKLLVSFNSDEKKYRHLTTGKANEHDYSWEEECLLVLRAASDTTSKVPLKQKPKILLTFGAKATENREAIEIKSLVFSPKDGTDLQCTAECAAASSANREGLVYLKFYDRERRALTFFPHFFLNPDTKQIVFHSYAGRLAKVRDILETQGEMRGINLDDVCAGGVGVSVKGHEQIERVCRKVNALQDVEFDFLNDTRHFANRETVATLGIYPYAGPAEGAKAEQGVASLLSLHTTVRWDGRMMSVCHPSEWGQKIFRSLEKGLNAFMPQDRKAFMDSRGSQKNHDLKLLSHLGIYTLILGQLISWLFDLKEKPSEDQIRAFESQSYKKAASILFDKYAGHGTLVLRDLCSPPMLKFLAQWVRDFIDQFYKDEVSFYTSKGKIVIQGYHHPFLRALSLLIEEKARETRGECYYKARTPFFAKVAKEPSAKEIAADTLATLQGTDTANDIPYDSVLIIEGGDLKHDSEPHGIPFHGWDPDQMLEILSPLRTSGIQLAFNGLSIEELAADAFKTEFVLSEKLAETESGGIPGNDYGRLDWFDLHPHFFLNGVEIEGEKALAFTQTGVLEHDGKLYILKDKSLPSLKYLEQFWKKLKTHKKEKKSRKANDSIFRLTRNATLDLLLLRAAGIPIKGTDAWQEVCRFYDSLSQARPSLALPPTVHAQLKHYQEEGVTWINDLFQLRMGGILADDMGLGKTLQSLSFLELLRSRDEMGHVLIVVPTSLSFNWIAEGSKFTPDLPMRIFQPKEKAEVSKFLEQKNAVIVCTYGLFVEHIEYLKKFSWNVHIYDEAQNLKNISAQRTFTSRSLPARFKLCLTGTPLENHLGELYSLLDLVVPGCLGDIDDFRKTFVSTREIDPKDIAGLRLKVKPLVLRRHKSEILKELPPKTESVVTIPFEKKQGKIYRDIAISWNQKVLDSVEQYGEAKSQIMMLTALLRLRQTCSDPAALPQIKYPETPPKISLLMDSLKEIVESGESAIVFTQFLATYERIAKNFKENGIPFFEIHGSHSHLQRKKSLESFQKSEQGAVMLMTLKTGGVGLNLTKASYVFHIEPWWNPAVENQATDRAHRMGQTKSVQIYRYLMRESVEEKIEILKKRKADRFKAIFGTESYDSEDSTPKKSTGFLSREDFEFLVKPPIAAS